MKKLRLGSNVCFLNDPSLEQHGFSRHIHVSSYYCVLLGSRRTKVLPLLCAMYVSSYYYYVCPQLILVLHADGRVCVEIKIHYDYVNYLLYC